MHLVLYDTDPWRINLYPLSLTRPVSDLRIGILTIAEKWEKWLKLPISYLTVSYLNKKYPLRLTDQRDALIISGNICPDEAFCEQVMALKIGEKLVDINGNFLAARTDEADFIQFFDIVLSRYKAISYDLNFLAIRYPEDIFLNNGTEIKKDFELITKGRSSAKISGTNTILGDHIFVEEGASAECSVFNTLKGPIYLGANSEVWEGALIRGAFALGKGSQVKMGTKIYSNVTVGPGCRVGGELNTCVLWGNSSKGHEGYFGSGVIGEWCNWGADSNNSNLKNNYKSVKLYHYGTKRHRDTGLQFCGVIMGDHAKCAINTSFNTGTVVGVSASIFGDGIPPTFIPDFSWGFGKDASRYDLKKMFETAELVFARRNCNFDRVEQEILEAVHRLTSE